MKFYVDCGEGLRIDWSLAIPYYRAPDYTMAHLHPHHELLFILDPLPYSAVIDGKILHGKGPVVMAIAPYCMHFTYYLDERIRDKHYIAAYVDEAFRKSYPEEIAPILNVMGNSKAVFFDIGEKADEFRAIMNLITSQFAKKNVPLSELWRKTNVKQQLLFGVLINMLNEIRMSGDNVQSVMGENNYIMDVIVYIIQNLDKKLTTPEIASLFFVSVAKLNRDFQKYAQMSIRRFIIEMRLNFAKSKIKGEKLPIAEIAEMCGFENIAYFYAFFKQNTGMTPHEYANNIKQ